MSSVATPPKKLKVDPKYYLHALGYHAIGWCVIPIIPETKMPPKGVTWSEFQKRRPTIEELEYWFLEKGYTGMAVVLGAVSGNLCCRDFDSMAGYNAWAKENPELAATLPTARSGRTDKGGGIHVFFSETPDAFKAANPTGSGTVTYMDGSGELFGDNRYMVLDPTKHKSGNPYQWMKRPDGFKLRPKSSKSEEKADNTSANQPVPQVSILDTGFLNEKGAPSTLPDVVEMVNNEAATIAEINHSNVEPVQKNRHKTLNSLDEISEASRQAIDDAIAATIPKLKGDRNLKLFKFSRMLHDIPEVVDNFSEGNGNIKKLDPIVRRWFENALKYDKTREWIPTLVEFRHGYARVKHSYKTGSLSVVAKTIDEMKPPKFAIDSYGCEPNLVRLVLLCKQLQRYHGTDPFFLSCASAAEQMGLKTRKNKFDSSRANRWLNLLVQDNVLRLVRKGYTGKASEYLYLMSLDE